MEYDKLIKSLLKTFPELRKEYDENKDYLENLPHLVYEDIFVPYIKEMLKKDKETENINKIFQFIENMINCTDEKVQEVAVVSVLEPLVAEREIVIQLKRSMCKKSIESFEIMEKAFGWSE